MSGAGRVALTRKAAKELLRFLVVAEQEIGRIEKGERLPDQRIRTLLSRVSTQKDRVAIELRRSDPFAVPVEINGKGASK
jgi:hypothetical protein